jgi:hypothetical protein
MSSTSKNWIIAVLLSPVVVGPVVGFTSILKLSIDEAHWRFTPNRYISPASVLAAIVAGVIAVRSAIPERTVRSQLELTNLQATRVQQSKSGTKSPSLTYLPRRVKGSPQS